MKNVVFSSFLTFLFAFLDMEIIHAQVISSGGWNMPTEDTLSLVSLSWWLINHKGAVAPCTTSRRAKTGSVILSACFSLAYFSWQIFRYTLQQRIAKSETVREQKTSEPGAHSTLEEYQNRLEVESHANKETNSKNRFHSIIYPPSLQEF